MLNVLLRKKKVRRTQVGRAFTYEAAVSRDGATGAALKDLVSRMFGGSGEAMLMALINTQRDYARSSSARAAFEAGEAPRRRRRRTDGGRMMQAAPRQLPPERRVADADRGALRPPALRASPACRRRAPPAVAAPSWPLAAILPAVSLAALLPHALPDRGPRARRRRPPCGSDSLRPRRPPSSPRPLLSPLSALPWSAWAMTALCAAVAAGCWSPGCWPPAPPRAAGGQSRPVALPPTVALGARKLWPSAHGPHGPAGAPLGAASPARRWSAPSPPSS